MSRIDPIRRAALVRRTARPDTNETDESQEVHASNLPVPVGTARTVPPRPARSGAGAEFAAHLLGQDGEKRGLRAGPSVIDTAKHSYNRTEWSGAKDRRARKGRMTKTDI